MWVDSALGELCPAVKPQVLLPELVRLDLGGWFMARTDEISLQRSFWVSSTPFHQGSTQRHHVQCDRSPEHPTVPAA